MRIFIIIIVLIPCLLFCNDSLNIRCVGTWPYSSSYNVIPIHGVTYLSVGAGLWILNTSDPTNPVKVGEFPLPGGVIRDMSISNRHLFLANSAVGLVILDVSNPVLPVMLSTFRIKHIYSVTVESDYAYITGNDSFFIFNVSNPSHPTRISATLINGMGSDIFVVSGRFAYVCRLHSGFTVYNITNPQSPVPLGYWTSPPYNPTVQSIWVRYGYAYVANRDSLRILNVSNPENILQVGVWGTTSPWQDRINEVFIKDSFAYLAFEHWGVHIINISNPQAPFHCSQIQIDYDRDIKVLDTLAYVATMAGLGILNITNPYQPVINSHWDKCPGGVLGVALSNNNTLSGLSCTEGVFFIDISNVRYPRLRSFLQWPTPGARWAYDIKMNDNFAFSSLMDSFRVINITNPDTPMVTGSQYIGWARALYLRNNLVYLAAQGSVPWAGFYIVDVSNPNIPTVISYVPYESDAYGIFVLGNYAYIGDGLYYQGNETGGFRIFNIADSTNPYQVCHHIPNFIGGTIKGIYVRNDTAYVCDENGLLIYNVANPTNPVFLSHYQTWHAADITIRGNLAFLADGYFGIRVLDISNPLSIRELGYYQVAGYANSIKIADNYIHCTFVYGGYLIFEYYGAGVKETGSEKLARKFRLKVLPQPTKQAILIEYSITKNSVVSLDILDSIGRVKKTLQKERMKPGNYQLNLNTTGLSPGVYFIRLRQDSEQIIEKFIVIN